MVGKLLVEVYVPAAGKRFEIYIPPFLRLHEILEMMKAAIEELCVGAYKPDKHTLLCSLESGSPLDLHLTPQAAGLAQGSRLFLV